MRFRCGDVHADGSFVGHAANLVHHLTAHHMTAHRLTSTACVASAPARVDLAGGWTDVAPYTTEVGGAVCNIAIELRAVATVRPAHDRDTAPPADTLVRAAWQRANAPPVSIQLESAIPHSSGLGGSSAAGVALAAALAAWSGVEYGADALAELSRSTETETMGLAGGCQDHYAAAFGGALLLRCNAQTTAERVPMSDATIAAFESQAMIAFTGESRMSSRTITAVLDAYRAGETVTCDALRTMASLAPLMATALRDGDIEQLGGLLNEQWIAQRALHPSITTPLIDRIAADAASGRCTRHQGTWRVRRWLRARHRCVQIASPPFAPHSCSTRSFCRCVWRATVCRYTSRDGASLMPIRPGDARALTETLVRIDSRNPTLVPGAPGEAGLRPCAGGGAWWMGLSSGMAGCPGWPCEPARAHRHAGTGCTDASCSTAISMWLAWTGMDASALLRP